ncbi:hypothetical protein CN491_08955 [Bacillus cereus]|uniref:HEAT repeat domain-containing protein n=1 Tax=Bacillus cereus TaxID=1396 RepID=A0A2A8LRS3_BACCE|nr:MULTISPECIES: hypothetical protein [Bacillus cereus group]MDR4984006.1 hypothetical protein [Bacillus cereus]MEA1011632.1 hypothetical protein [Bacillus cereus]PES96689.1 hypothetical protein CN491_08955 [Bacillus cereus]PGT17773.1 hypothetical protein COC96_14720 [Bacillus cereus]
MYEKLDTILSENSSDNYFYDDEFMYVQELISGFADIDWAKLVRSLKDRDDKYKIRLVYCIDEDTGMNGFNLLLDLLNENDEVAEYVIDSLRSFNNEEYKKRIASNKKIMDKAESLLKNASLPVKRILETFLQQNKQS